MRVAVDTNILAYAEGVNDPERQARANEIIAAFLPSNLIIPVQVLGELFRVLTGKARWPAARARAAVEEWRAAYPVWPTTEPTLTAALDLAVAHRLTIWDAVILNAAAESGCRLLLSEDLAEGFAWRGVSVTNPFAAEPHPLLRGM
jgi:predicted nucleic acid-binding protein